MKQQTKTAYSYVRFSDRKQAGGDSLRRQLEWGPALCAGKGWTLDETLEPDEGVSAFRGKNALTGKLAEFLRLIGTGKVTPGSVLLLESLDRLSREDIDPAWELFRKVLKAGVEVYTREPERHYLPADLSNFGTRIEVQAYFLRAYNESATKSMRGREYWQKSRAKLADRKIHNVPPAWLRLSEDRKRFELVPEAVKAIKLIFKWAAEGMGCEPITARLNREGVPPIGNNIRRKVFKKCWGRSYVGKLLRDRAILGEYTPHTMQDGKRVPHGEPIPAYFPPVVSEKQWYAARQAVKGRGETRGRTGPMVANLFSGIVRDARDGETCHQIYTHTPFKAHARKLVSYGCRNGTPGSTYSPFPYDPLESHFLQAVEELKAADIANNDKVDDLDGDIATAKGKLDDLSQKIAAVQKRVADKPGIDALLTLLESLDNLKVQAAADLERLKHEAANRQPAALGEVRSLARLLRDAKGDEAMALRTKIKARIRQLVSEMWLLTWDVSPEIRAAEVQIVFRTGKVRGLLLAWARRGRYRGLVTGADMVLAEAGQDRHLADKRLAEYRTNAAVRQWFDSTLAKLAVPIKKVVTTEGMARLAYADEIAEADQAHEAAKKALEAGDYDAVKAYTHGKASKGKGSDTSKSKGAI